MLIPPRLRIAMSGRLNRRAAPSCRGGASSLLRLSLPVDHRLPTADELVDWMNRDSSVVMPVTGLHLQTTGSEFGIRHAATS